MKKSNRNKHKIKAILFFKYWRRKQLFRHCHMWLENRYISMDEYDSMVAESGKIDFDIWWDEHFHSIEANDE